LEIEEQYFSKILIINIYIRTDAIRFLDNNDSKVYTTEINTEVRGSYF